MINSHETEHGCEAEPHAKNAQLAEAQQRIAELEHALAVSQTHEREYKALFDEAPMAYQSLDAEGNFIAVNQAWLDLLGYHKAEVIGHSFSEFLSPRVKPLFPKRFAQFMAEGKICSVEWEMLQKNGDHMIASFEGTINYDAEGDFQRTHCIMRNITEYVQMQEKQRKSEEALRQREALLNASQRHSLTGGWEWNATNDTMYWTDEMYRLHGMNPVDIEAGEAAHIAHSIQCYNPEDRAVILDAFNRCKQYGEGYDLEFPFTTYDHRRIWVRTTAKAVWEEGKIVKVIGILSDITALKKTQNIEAAQYRLVEFAENHSTTDILQKLLDEVEAITSSKISFCHFIENDAQMLSIQTGSTNTMKQMGNIDNQNFHYPISAANIWADCIRKKTIVVQNDYAHLEHKKGPPKGHPSVSRVLIVPVIRGEIVVAILGVGNKESDYEQPDVDIVNKMANLAWEIVERKRAEESLRKNEAELSAIYNNAPLVMLLVDQDRRIVKMNTSSVFASTQPMINGIGLRSGEVLHCVHVLDGTHGCGFDPNCDDCVINLAIHQTFETGQGIYRKEATITLNHSGKLQPLYLLASTNLIEELEEPLVLVCLEDITENKLAEIALRESEEKHRLLFEYAGQMIAYLDLEGTIIALNPVAQEYIGCSAEECIGLSISSVLGDKIGNMLKRRIQIAEHTQGTQVYEDSYSCPGNDTLWLLSNWTRMLDVNQQIVGVQAVAIDITEQKKAEGLIRQERDTAQQFLDVAGVLICAIDVDGTVTLMNKRGCEILGYAVEDIVGKNWFEHFLPEKYIKPIQDKLNDILKDGYRSEIYGENPVLTSSGEERLIAWYNTVVYDRDGRVVGTLSSGQDITERRKAEEQLKHALREKTILLQELYHRTKNNMQVISALLTLQAVELTDKDALKAFEVTKNRIQSMSLVHEKLYQSQDLSRINLKEYIHDLVGLLLMSYQIPHNKITLHLDLNDVWVVIDTAIPCGLILNELTSNILQHAFPDGRTGEIHIQLQRQKTGTIQIKVADNGVGVPPGFVFQRDSGLGIKNIFALVEMQLRGSVTFTGHHGVSCLVQFTDDLYEERV